MRQNGFKTRIVAVILMGLMATGKTYAVDFVSYDPLWMLAVGYGHKKVLDQINTQKTKMIEIAALQNTMALHFNAVKEWQRKYNNYLKTTQGYAEALRAGANVTAQAVKTLRDLKDLKKVMERNPEGIAATLAINDLYMETATEFINTFRTLKFSLTTGGEFNMLTGKERTEMLWALVDQMDELNTKLRKLILSVAYFRVKDVWAFYTRGMFDINKTDIAEQCLERWTRIQETMRILN